MEKEGGCRRTPRASKLPKSAKGKQTTKKRKKERGEKKSLLIREKDRQLGDCWEGRTTVRVSGFGKVFLSLRRHPDTNLLHSTFALSTFAVIGDKRVFRPTFAVVLLHHTPSLLSSPPRNSFSTTLVCLFGAPHETCEMGFLVG